MKFNPLAVCIVICVLNLMKGKVIWSALVSMKRFCGTGAVLAKFTFIYSNLILHEYNLCVI